MRVSFDACVIDRARDLAASERVAIMESVSSTFARARRTDRERESFGPLLLRLARAKGQKWRRPVAVGGIVCVCARARASNNFDLNPKSNVTNVGKEVGGAERMKNCVT